MTIKEALNEICAKAIPKEINGVRTKYVVQNRNHDFNNEIYQEVAVDILLVDLEPEYIAVSRRYMHGHLIFQDYERSSMEYRRLEREIDEMLCLYTANVISRFQGKAIETRAIDIDIAMISDMRKENDELKRLLKAALCELNNGTCAKFCSTCTKMNTEKCKDYKRKCYHWVRTDEVLKLIGEDDNEGQN